MRWVQGDKKNYPLYARYSIALGFFLFPWTAYDGSYAHSFALNQDINISNSRNAINGVNKGAGDSVSLKLTLNF